MWDGIFSKQILRTSFFILSSFDIDAEEVHEPEVQEEAKPEPQAKSEDTAEPKRTF